MSLLRPAAPLDLSPASARRARRHMLGLYLLLGITVATWLARYPAVRDALDLTAAELGRILLVGALGSLATVFVAGGIVTRFGSRRVLVWSAGIFTTGAVLLGVGPTIGSVPVLVAGIVLQSVSFALGNVPLNVETVTIERAIGRSVVPHFHAAFSIGSVAGSGLGALAAWAEVPVLVQFSVVGLAALVWRLVAIPVSVLPVPPVVAEAPAGPPRRGAGLRAALAGWREPRTLLVGLIVMAAALSEGTANNWVTLAVVDGFAASEAVAALTFGAFVAAMAGSRLLGTRLIDRFGPVTVIAASGASGLAGLLMFVFAPGLPGAVAGVVLWGMGAGLPFPIAMTAVSQDPLRAAGRVAVVSAFASVASLAAPPLLGLLAESVGIRTALLAIAWALALSIVLARVVRPEVPDAGAATGADGAPDTVLGTVAAGPVPAGPGDAVPVVADSTAGGGSAAPALQPVGAP